MKWIPCSERLPEKKTDDIYKDKGIIFREIKKSTLMYIFQSITKNIPFLLQKLEDWEWLDESESPSTREKELEDALRELVELKDIKDKMDKSLQPDLEFPIVWKLYQERKPLAWETARKLIASSSKNNS